MSVDMIDEKLDFALAGLLGWVNWWDGVRLIWVDGATKEFRRKVTDWHPSSDPAASLEVQAAAIKANDRQYVINLAKRLEWDGDDLEYSDNDVFSYIGVTVFMLASPRERAEAAYTTLSIKD
ncbi:hypothetical protein ACYCSU_23925 [Paenibacillus sp. ALE1]